ncbi:MAG TPA: HD domain-containing protein [Methylomirabilota bacterium]|jgi:putative nucleotidyltransferase with HDIG domain
MAVLRLERLAPSEIVLLRAVAAAAGRGVEPMLVGGAVRDARLGRQRRPDVDVAVASGALDLGRRVASALGGAFVVLDEERGAARVLTGGGQLDITDFRAPTLAEDLAARDFTVNALAVPVRGLLHGRAQIIDPVGGLGDLGARRLRLAGPRALTDDPLRALRAVRLEALLGLRLTPAAGRAVSAAAPALAGVAAERVRDELLALLALPETARALRRADQLRLLSVVFPEIEPMRITRQPLPHRFPVLEHSLRAVGGADRVVAGPERLAPFGEELATHLGEPIGGGMARRDVLKLAALLHDVAKPETRRVIHGRVRFFGHDLRGAARSRVIGERLRLPGTVVTAVERLVRHHLRTLHLAAAGQVTPRARYRFYRDLGPETRDLLLLTLVDAAAVRGDSPLALWPRAALIRDLLAGWELQREAAAAPALIRGEDVMTRFGLGPGPEVGRLLRRTREAQDLGLVHTREQALTYLDSVVREPLQ